MTMKVASGLDCQSKWGRDRWNGRERSLRESYVGGVKVWEEVRLESVEERVEEGEKVKE